MVSNCGGLLTPLGDPPLFLGFLKGVPFEWTLALWPQWLLVNGLLLVVFNAWDQLALGREERERAGSQLEAGAKLGTVGDSARRGVSGLHLEIRRVRQGVDVRALRPDEFRSRAHTIACDARNVLALEPER